MKSWIRSPLGKIVLTSCIVLLAFIIVFYIKNPLIARVRIGDDEFYVDVAVTDEEITKGLGMRDALPQDGGMLFAFSRKDRFTFWMKDMRFPIDIIWIEDNTIMDVSANVPVATTTPLPTYQPRTPVNKVLEINAGEAARRNLRIGDTVEILD